MAQTTATEHPTETTDRLGADEYNYTHFTRAHLVTDIRQSAAGAGLRPGEPAPDFSLEDTDGNRISLRDLRDKPVLLRFGSFT